MSNNNVTFNDDEKSLPRSTVDDILILDDEDEKPKNNENNTAIKELDYDYIPEPETKHTLITSGWSRLGMVGIPLGLGFLIVFALVSGIGGGGKSAQKQETSTDKQETLQAVDDKDGDVYAQLALGKQEQELDKIDSKNQSQSEKTENKADVSPQKVAVKNQPVVVTSTPPSPRTVERNYSQPQQVYQSPRSNYSSVIPTTSRQSTQPRTTQTLDPIAELNRLRNIGSFGKIAYGDPQTGSTEQIESDIPNEQDKSSNKSSNVEDEQDDNNNNDSPIESVSNEGSIEKIRPRWTPKTSISKYTIASDYLTQLDSTNPKTRYLRVGEFANGKLITPLLKEQQQTNSQQNSNSNKNTMRFVAKLTQDLRDNNGKVAIAAGSLMAIEVESVDGASYVSAFVTSIIKDDTEYPIPKGAIAVLGKDSTPLVARPFKDKGGEFAQQDITLGILSGLGKVGEILNQPEQEDETEDVFGRVRRRTNNRRNVTGAVLEGAFGKLSEVASERSQQSSEEIAARPNIWYVPKDTRVTFMVNRTLELP